MWGFGGAAEAAPTKVDEPLALPAAFPPLNGPAELEKRIQTLEEQSILHGELIAKHAAHIASVEQQSKHPSSDSTALALPDASSIKGDVEQVIDAMRRDLASQRKMLDNFHTKMEPMRDNLSSNNDSLQRLQALQSFDPKSLRAEFVSVARFSEVCADLKLEVKSMTIATSNMKNSASNMDIASESSLANPMQQPQQASSNTGFVPMRVFNETVANLRSTMESQMSMLHSMLEHTALRSGYLAVAASECTAEEKMLLFETLRGKERDLGFPSGPQSIQNNTNPQSMANLNFAVNDLLNFDAPSSYANRSAPSAYPSPGAAFSPAPQEIMITVQRQPGARLGLSVDGSDLQTLLVQRIDDGLLSSHNAANPSQALQVFDRIVAVNGKRGTPDVLLDEIKNEQVAATVLAVARPPRPAAAGYGTLAHQHHQVFDAPAEFVVTLKASGGQKLGLSVDCDDYKTLVVGRINPGGLMEAWNQANPGQAIKPGDRIAMANFKRGDPTALLEECSKVPDSELVLGFIRA